MERVHKLSAAILFAFLCLHIGNHLVGLEGIDAHRQFLDAARLIYRHPVVEIVLLIAIAVQIVTGVPLIFDIWRRKKDFVHQLLALSGLLLLLFFVLHVAWIALGREIFHLDTDFYYAAAGFVLAPEVAYSVYGTGLMALFVHVACIAYGVYKKHNRPVAWTLLLAVTALGGYVTWLILSVYAGRFFPVHVPDAYLHISL